MESIEGVEGERFEMRVRGRSERADEFFSDLSVVLEDEDEIIEDFRAKETESARFFLNEFLKKGRGR